MVEHAQIDLRAFGELEMGEGAPGLDAPQICEAAVQQPMIGTRFDQRCAVTPANRRAEAIPVTTEARARYQ